MSKFECWILFILISFLATANPAAKLLDKLFSKLVEPELQNPTFVLDHPLCMSPLAKEHRSKPGICLIFKE